VLDEAQFLSRYGVRSVSKLHAVRQDLGELPGLGYARMEYQPGEAASGMFGGNSNWRGPIWLPTNYLLIQSIEKYHRYLGASFTVAAPCLGGQAISLKETANLLAERLVDLFRRGQDGRIPAYAPDSSMQHDPNWRDLHLFHEYFHGESGQGLGAAHQTGWTVSFRQGCMNFDHWPGNVGAPRTWWPAGNLVWSGGFVSGLHEAQ